MSYNPSYFTPSNKPYGVQGIPDGARMYHYDPVTFELRPFVSREEVIAYFPSALLRKGHFTAIINTDGVHSEWWWKDGVTDDDLVLKESGGGGVVTTKGSISLEGARKVIFWENDLVDGELITWSQKHGDLAEVVIQTSRPDPIDSGFFVQTLDYKKDLGNSMVILENGEDALQYLFMSKKPTELIPTVTLTLQIAVLDPEAEVKVNGHVWPDRTLKFPLGKVLPVDLMVESEGYYMDPESVPAGTVMDSDKTFNFIANFP